MNTSLLAALRTATGLARARKPEEATSIIRQALGDHRHMPLPKVSSAQPATSLGRGLAETLRTLRARRHPPSQAAIADEQVVDRASIFVAGMSAGGAMAAILAATHPDLFAGISIHSGLPFGAAHDTPSALAAMRGEPTNSLTRPPLVRATKGQPRLIVFHGDADVTASPANGDAIVEAARATLGRSSDEVVRGATAGGRSFTRTITHDANGRAVLEHWVVHGGGHAWAGGHAAGSFTDPACPDASAEIIRFFLHSSHAEGTLSCN